MQLRPILSSLRQHKLTAILLTLQVAFTCAIVCNVAFLITQRVQRVTVPSGLDESAVSVIRVNDLQAGANPLGVHKADLAALRQIPGVQSAAIISHLPLSRSMHSSGVCASLKDVHAAMAAQSINVPGCVGPDIYKGGTQVVKTLGLKLVAGHGFGADDVAAGKAPPGEVDASGVILSQTMAQRLYPHGHAVGNVVYYGNKGFDGRATPIIGVVAHLERGYLGKVADNGITMLVPVVPNRDFVQFVLHSHPTDRAQVLKTAVTVLETRRPERQISSGSAQTYAQIRADYFQRDTTMISLLLAAALGLLFVTALGIAGLASFWVQQRRRSIGIRRAIGATRADILRYFLGENFLIVTGGIVLGLLLAYGLNLWLMQHYELLRLPWIYLPMGAVSLWLLGQLSVLAPALRASRVPPVVATRSV